MVTSGTIAQTSTESKIKKYGRVIIVLLIIVFIPMLLMGGIQESSNNSWYTQTPAPTRSCYKKQSTITTETTGKLIASALENNPRTVIPIKEAGRIGGYIFRDGETIIFAAPNIDPTNTGMVIVYELTWAAWKAFLDANPNSSWTRLWQVDWPKTPAGKSGVNHPIDEYTYRLCP